MYRKVLIGAKCHYGWGVYMKYLQAETIYTHIYQSKQMLWSLSSSASRQIVTYQRD